MRAYSSGMQHMVSILLHYFLTVPKAHHRQQILQQFLRNQERDKLEQKFEEEWAEREREFEEEWARLHDLAEKNRS